MDKHDYFLLVVLFLAVFIPMFLAWYFVQRARFKEKIILIEKGIDIKDLNLMENKNKYSPGLKTGIVITGTALGALLTAIIHLGYKTSNAVILLFIGISIILAYFIDSKKDQK